jgi:hypothetical protein
LSKKAEEDDEMPLVVPISVLPEPSAVVCPSLPACASYVFGWLGTEALGLNLYAQVEAEGPLTNEALRGQWSQEVLIISFTCTDRTPPVQIAPHLHRSHPTCTDRTPPAQIVHRMHRSHPGAIACCR